MGNEEEFRCCSYCGGISWCIRSEIKNGRNYPFVFPCPMCNPHEERPPVDVDREEIGKLIEKRKKEIPKCL